MQCVAYPSARSKARCTPSRAGASPRNQAGIKIRSGPPRANTWFCAALWITAERHRSGDHGAHQRSFHHRWRRIWAAISSGARLW
jgi:hypothetical protein